MGMERFASACKWIAGDGNSILFWSDIWNGEESLRTHFPLVFHISNCPEGRASSFWETNGQAGGWHLQLFRPPSGSEASQAELLTRALQGRPLVLYRTDKVWWGRSPDEGYSVRNGYLWWRRPAIHNPAMVEYRRAIWGSVVPLKVKAFIWLVCHGRVLTKTYCLKWCPNLNTTCVLCEGAEETTDHLFRGCPVARWVWGRLGMLCTYQSEWPSMGEFWAAVTGMTTHSDWSLVAKVRRLVVPAGLWAICLSRNSVIFRGQRFYQENLWELLEVLLRDWGRFIAGASFIELHIGVLHIMP
ncbi:hypothetical protein QJS10_CPA07g01220 [Acorus calamus]|uniref:Reverse transcriptase zinc-binding domain-containing protein n=1 Tax=Acorus calamus TaxID=4465 RepID=A0AAV9EGR8_ACOCL|nr:hypothetical protein QJS10_CPA07g01220 [Acorus calamus]